MDREALIKKLIAYFSTQPVLKAWLFPLYSKNFTTQNTMKRPILTILASAAWGLATEAQTQLSLSDINNLYTTQMASGVSIHDPSVVLRGGMYTVWGSHLGVAQSRDLQTWTPLSAGSSTFVKLTAQGDSQGTACNHREAFNKQQVVRVKNCRGEEVTMPNIDAEAYANRYAADREAWVDGNMWAPDIIYNKEMQKWCMYISLNGDHWASIIVLLTANQPTGPFTYQGPVVMGGFNGQTYDGVAAPTIADTDYEIATGETTMPARYKRTDTGNYWPNCIDPCVFYDEEGELWMAYGSWSGGIFMLKLDKQTGLRDYTYTYPSDYAAKGMAGVSDPYYGRKIAGGCYVSGEGSYIQHIGDHYYLFMSDGFYSPDGGYEMRVFRSEKPEGPYTDGSGTAATYTSYVLNYGPNSRSNAGMKLMGAYNHWGNQTVGVCAQGHNSACTDNAGRTFVVYHTKMNNGTAWHQVRVHQLFLNEKGWPVAAPFAYAGETQTDADIAQGCPWTTEQLVGTYHLLLHPYRQDHANFEESTPVEVMLTEDGRVTGAYTGSWTTKDGTAYVTLRLGATTYYGVWCEQHVSGTTERGLERTSLGAIALTAQSTAGVSVWGYKLQAPYAVAYNYKSNEIAVKNGNTYSSNINLMFPTEENTTLTWTSSRPDIISETGKYNPAGLTAAEPVTLTARLTSGDYYWEQTYNVKAQKEIIPAGDYLSGIVAYYDFDEAPCQNAYDGEQKTTFGTTGTKPALQDDYSRFGKVLHQSFGAQGSNSYTRMPNPLKGITDLDGMTVSMWVKRTDDNVWDAVWGFFNATSAAAQGSRFYLTGNAYMGYNDNAGKWFDINHPNNGTYTDIPVGKWALVTLTVGPTNGVALYVNGVKKAAHAVASASGATTAKTVEWERLLEQLAAYRYFYLGLGSFWGSADCCVDDLIIYRRELTSTDVRALNTMSNRVCDFSRGEGGAAIDGVTAPSIVPQGIYDLSGRRYAEGQRLGKGVYIINGNKVIKK